MNIHNNTKFFADILAPHIIARGGERVDYAGLWLGKVSLSRLAVL